MITITDETIIESSSFYFAGNINLRVPIDEKLVKALEKLDVKIKTYDQVNNKEIHLSELFTKHFKDIHKPLNFSLGTQTAEVDLEELKKIDHRLEYNRFDDLILAEKLMISWRTFITSNGMGTIILEFHTQKPLPQSIHRKLSLLYLNFPILKTEGLDYLFVTPEKDENDNIIKMEQKDYISIEDLCERYEIELLAKIRNLVATNKIFQGDAYHVLPDQGWKRFKSLSYETIIPIIVLNIKKSSKVTQLQWLEDHKEMISYYIAKPELFEMGKLSEMYIESMTKKEKIWSISECSMALGTYHGFVRLQFLEDDKKKYNCDQHILSGFLMDSQNAYLYTVLITIQNYFTLRIFDDYLDEKGDKIRDSDGDFLEKIKLVSEVLNKIYDQVEEVENIDKLIDSDPHIDLTDLIGNAFQIDKWMGMVMKKIGTLEKYVATSDYTESNRSAKSMEKALYVIAIVGLVTGVIEALSSFHLF